MRKKNTHFLLLNSKTIMFGLVRKFVTLYNDLLTCIDKLLVPQWLLPLIANLSSFCFVVRETYLSDMYHADLIEAFKKVSEYEQEILQSQTVDTFL